MQVSTQGIEVRHRSALVRAAVELLSSMRFSISLLSVICIASVIGTIVKQHEPSTNYVNQFGPFWAEVFAAFGLNAVYSAWWFLLILAFLVLSTSLCIARNTPRIMADLRAYKEHIRVQSLQAFGHRASATLPGHPQAQAQHMAEQLRRGGWRVKLQERHVHGSAAAAGASAGWMVAARAGSANKWGYLAAHSAIVLVCVGGLLDGDLMVRAQMWWGGKAPYSGGGMIADVKPEHRLSERNPAFRGNLLVAEGTQSSTAILNQSDGILLQELPFTIELKKFVVDYYSTGMPKLFASDIVIHDKVTGEKIPARVEVNHPARHRGIDIFQSSFDDGGSRVKLKAVPMSAAGKAFEVEGVIGGSSNISNGKDTLTLEYTGLRLINVENFASGAGSGADVRKVDLRQSIEARLGSAQKTVTQKELRNVGPSISYKLRDSAGQAHEFNNYMLPVDMGDGRPLFLLGVRDTPAQPFRYLRVPADEQSSMDGFLRLRDALTQPALREQAVRRYAATAVEANRPELVAQLTESAARALTLFAGSAGAGPEQGKMAGLQALSEFIETNVPPAERERAGQVLVRILNGSLFELLQLSRAQAGLQPAPADEATQAFMAQAVIALSDAPFYPAPVAFELKDFNQVQASVFQVARAPGRNIVYLGCTLLILGVFAMLYVRERRLWVWLSPQGDATSQATMAYSSNRQTMDTDREFDSLQKTLLREAL